MFLTSLCIIIIFSHIALSSIILILLGQRLVHFVHFTIPRLPPSNCCIQNTRAHSSTSAAPRSFPFMCRNHIRLRGESRKGSWLSVALLLLPPSLHLPSPRTLASNPPLLVPPILQRANKLSKNSP